MPQFIYAYVYAIVYVLWMYSPLPAVRGLLDTWLGRLRPGNLWSHGHESHS